MVKNLMKIKENIKVQWEFKKYVKEIKTLVKDLEEIDSRIIRANKDFKILDVKFIIATDSDKKILEKIKDSIDISWAELQRNVRELAIRVEFLKKK